MDAKLDFEEITILTKKYINSLILREYGNNPIFPSLNFMIEKRNNAKHWLRPYLLYSSFKISRELIDINSLLPALAAVELINISNYQTNLVFDNKIEHTNRTIDNNQVIASYFIYDLAIREILSLKQYFGEEKTKKCLEFLLNANKQIYAGQFEDLNIINFNINPASLKWSKSEFLERYFNRCVLYGSTIKLCVEIGTTLAIISEQKRNDLLYISIEFAKMLQLINDLSDFLCFIGNVDNYKKYSDIKQGICTLPIYILYRNLSTTERMAFMLQKENSFNILFIQEIIQNHIYKKSKIINEIKQEIDSIWNNIYLIKKKYTDKEFTDIIKLMRSIIFRSKISTDLF